MESKNPLIHFCIEFNMMQTVRCIKQIKKYWNVRYRNMKLEEKKRTKIIFKESDGNDNKRRGSK